MNTRARRRSTVRRGLATTACAALGMAVLVVPPAVAEPAPASTPDQAAVQAALDQIVAGGATGALALVDEGPRTWGLASGVARTDPRRELSPDVRFRIGSLTKTFVATLALQLVAEGRLDLDDPVGRWVPDVLPDDSQITLRMLLNHTSGLYDYTSSPDFRAWVDLTPTRPTTTHALVALAAAQPRTFPPGQGWAYSNTGYLVAGLMIEAATGRAVEDLIEDRLVDPLGLTATSFPKRAPNISGDHARGYLPPTLTGQDDHLDVTKLSPTLLWAAGGMISTAQDVSRFLSALLGGQVLPPAMLEEMLTAVPLGPDQGYGLGIESLDGGCGTVWGHRGSSPGYYTMAYSDPSGDRGVVVMVPTRPDETTFGLVQRAFGTAVCQVSGPDADGATMGS